MREEIFDKNIKEKLDSLDTSTSSPDWSAFKTKMEEVRFDSKLAEKISSDTPAIPPMDWGSFKTKLNAQNPDSSFDQKFSEKLKNISPDTPKMDWSKMKSAIDKDFDNHIVNLVDEAKPTIREDHWFILRDKLRQYKYQQYKNYGTIALVAVIATLLLTLGIKNSDRLLKSSENLTLNQNITPKITNDVLVPSSNVNAKPNAVKTATDSIFSKRNNGVSNGVTNTPNENVATVSQPINTTKDDRADNTSAITYTVTNNIVPTSKANIAINEIGTTTESKTTVNPSRKLSIPEIDTAIPEVHKLQNTPLIKEIFNEENYNTQIKVETNINSDDSNAKSIIENSSDSNKRQKIYIAALETIENPISLEKMDFGDMKFSTSELNTFEKDNNHSFVEFAYGYVKNSISSPYDSHYKLAATQAESRNQQYSLLLGKKKGKIEYFTGIKYGSISYKPRQVIEQIPTYNSSVTYATSLDKIKFDNIAIPIGIRFLKNEGKHSLYGMASVNTHIVTYTNYKVNFLINNKQYEESLPGAPEDSLLEKKNFHRGIFSGGSLTDNIYYSLGAGLGYRFELTSRFSLFTQVQYNHHILTSRLGPNRDRISSLNTDLGLRFRL